MKKLCLLISVFCSWTVSARSTPPDVGAINETSMSDAPVSFTPNEGQWPDSIKFRAVAGGATMWFGQSGAYYQFTRSTTPNAPAVDPAETASPDTGGIETMLIKASFVGANPEPIMVGIEETGSRSHFYLGSNPSHWRTNVLGYRAVLYQDLYPGIDLRYYGDGCQMEYDFIAAPGADLNAIQIRYGGANSVSVNSSGELVVQTEWGTITERAPVVYQAINGERRTVRGEYTLVAALTFGFKLDQGYNPAFAVVIDPKLVYSSYFGGSGEEYATDISLDDSGYVYFASQTTSSNFPVVGASGAYNHLHGAMDVTLTKLTPDCSAIVWSLYIGGSYYDSWPGVATDRFGNVYISGNTYSADFPTLNPLYPYNQGNGDDFVAKFNRAGTLLYSTFFGGTGQDWWGRIDVDSTGNVYLAGTTQSSNLPCLLAHDLTYNGANDAFVAKIAADGQSLVFCTYLGGSGAEESHAIHVDAQGNVYVAGLTASSNYPTTAGAFDVSYGGSTDGYVTKIPALGGPAAYSTYIGGSDFDDVVGLTSIPPGMHGPVVSPGVRTSPSRATAMTHPTVPRDKDIFAVFPRTGPASSIRRSSATLPPSWGI